MSPSRLRATDWYVLAWWGVNGVLFLHVVLAQPALWVTYLYNGILYTIGSVLAYEDTVLRRIFILATVAGVIELGADYFLVEVANTLVYPQTLPMLLRSPLYMPLAWAIVITQLGYLAWRLAEESSRRAAIVGPAGVAMGLIGTYETGAHIAGIWTYSHAPLLMIGHAPVFIIIAEGVMFATLYYFIRQVNPVLAGIGFGLVITLSYIGAYSLSVLLGG